MLVPADGPPPRASRRSSSGRDTGRRPVVSVLLPCRNVAPWLSECIDSLEVQTLDSFEIVAVDDASTDGTGELLGEWATRNRRVRVVPHASGESDAAGGLVRALELAVGLARGRLIARMDADDVAHPERLERQVRYLEDHRDVAACGTRVELFPATSVGAGYSRYAAWLNDLTAPADVERDLLVECPIAHPSLMIRTSVLRGLGGYRDAGWPEDYDLVLRLHAVGLRAANLPQTLLRWRVRPDRHSLGSPAYSPGAFRRCKVHFLRECFLPIGRPIVVWGAGRVGKPLARELLRQGCAVRAFVDLDPRKVGQEIHGAPVLDPQGFVELAGSWDPYVLVAVGSPGARQEIRRGLAAMGRTEIADYRACA